MRVWRLLLPCLLAGLSGCCAFVPCHPQTSVVGLVVSSETERAIPDADVRLFGDKVTVSRDGCFKTHLPWAYPLTLTVSATGYKGAASSVEAGFQRVRVILHPAGSVGDSAISWGEIEEEEFADARACAQPIDPKRTGPSAGR